MANKRSGRKQQQQKVAMDRQSRASSSSAAPSSMRAESSSHRTGSVSVCVCSNGDGDALPHGRSAAAASARDADAGSGCRHVARGVNLEKLAEKLRKVEVGQCHECGDGSCPDNGGREKKGKIKRKVAKKKGQGQLNFLKNGGAVGAVMVCLACGHVGCAAPATAKEASEERDGEGDLSLGFGHARQHFLQWKHSLALHHCGENSIIWCFQCDSSIPIDRSSFSLTEDSPTNSSDADGGLLSRVGLLQQAVKLLEDKFQSQMTVAAPQLDTTPPPPSRQIHPSDSFTPSSQDHRKAKPRIRGLMNLGNTCFLNSVLQALLALNLLYNHFCKSKHGTEGFLTSALRKFYGDYYASNGEAVDHFEAKGKSNRGLPTSDSGISSSLNPKIVFSAICSKSSRFKGYQQQDSHEVLRCLLDGLHTEEQTESRKIVGGLQHSGAAGMRISNLADGLHEEEDAIKSSNNSETFVEKLFGGQLSSTVSCCECSHSSVVYEQFLDISLPLPVKSVSKKALPSKGFSQNKVSIIKSGRPHASKSLKKSTFKALNTETSEDADLRTKFPDSSESGNASAALAEKEPTSSTAGVSSCSQGNEVVEDFNWLDYVREEESEPKNFQESNFPQDFVAVPAAGGAPELVPFGETNLLNQQGVESFNSSGSSLISASCTIPASIGLDCVEDSEKLRQASVSDVILLPYWDSEYVAAEMNSNALTEPSNGCTTESPLPLGNPIKEMSDETAPITYSAQFDVNSDFDGFSELFEEVTSHEYVSLASDRETEEGTFTGAAIIEVNQSSLPQAHSQDESGDAGGKIKHRSQQRETHTEKTVEPMSLEKCFEIFTTLELLSGENAWECDNCSRACSDTPKSTNTRQIKHSEVGHNCQTASLRGSNNNGSIPFISEKGDSGAAVRCIAEFETDAATGASCQVRSSTPQLIAGALPLTNPQRFKDGSPPLFNLLKGGDSNGCLNFDKHVISTEEVVCIGDGTDSVGETGSVQSYCRLGSEEQRLIEPKSSALDLSKIGYNAIDVSCSDEQPTFEAKKSMFIMERVAELQHEADSESVIFSRTDSSCSSTTKLSKKGLKSQKSQSGKVKAESTRVVKRNATKRLLISRAPPILTVHLKRFSQDNHGRLSKISGHIAFSESLDLHPFQDFRCLSFESWTYRLVGIVEHSGSMKGGHYVAYVRGNSADDYAHDVQKADPSQGNLWYYISDSHVSRTTIENVLRSEAYLLFYERIHIKS